MLREVGYDAATRTLEATFRRGEVYRYHHVPLAIYGGLLACRSKGRYMRAVVFGNYPFERVTPRAQQAA
jgi:hypothetical protein